MLISYFAQFILYILSEVNEIIYLFISFWTLIHCMITQFNYINGLNIPSFLKLLIIIHYFPFQFLILLVMSSFLNTVFQNFLILTPNHLHLRILSNLINGTIN